MKKLFLIMMIIPAYSFAQSPQEQKEYWGAYIYLSHPNNEINEAYALSWNYGSRDKALQGAVEHCRKKYKIKCWPQYQSPSTTFTVPNLVVIFSTSAIEVTKHLFYIENARCILIYRNTIGADTRLFSEAIYLH